MCLCASFKWLTLDFHSSSHFKRFFSCTLWVFVRSSSTFLFLSFFLSRVWFIDALLENFDVHLSISYQSDYKTVYDDQKLLKITWKSGLKAIMKYKWQPEKQTKSLWPKIIHKLSTYNERELERWRRKIIQVIRIHLFFPSDSDGTNFKIHTFVVRHFCLYRSLCFE